METIEGKSFLMLVVTLFHFYCGLRLREATEIVSSVAYPEVCSLIYEFSGVTVPLDTEKKLTVLEEPICTLLVVKLRFRIKAERKGVERHKDINEYEFVRIDYKRE